MTPREFAIQVTEKLQAAGFQALWAGGCVRDQLLGRTPKDFDVATDATPDQIQDLFGRRRTLALGATFGVITVIGPRSAGNIEVATFRSDAQYSDGRRPDYIEFSTAEVDAQRRDFTINGLFYDPLSDQILDFVGGRRDLDEGWIRAIGNPAARIAEDKLRMLRAVRFAANLDFALAASTRQTIQQHASEITLVSAERISAELEQMLVHDHRRRAVQLMMECGLLEPILPEVTSAWQDAALREDTLGRLQRLSTPSLAVAWSTLLTHAIRPRQVAAICQRLKLSNKTKQIASWILQHEKTLRQAADLPWSIIQPLLVQPHASEALDFLRADPHASTAVKFCESRLSWESQKLDPPVLLDGNQLIQLGWQPGPHYKQVLQEVRRAQLDGEISTREQALEIARGMANERRQP